MDMKHIADFAAIPQIPREKWGFIDDLKAPVSYAPNDARACDAGRNADCLAKGIRLVFEAGPELVPPTALRSLERVLAAKKIEKQEAGYPVVFRRAPEFAFEEFEVVCDPGETLLRAADAEGMRRAVFFFEDRLREAAGKSVMPCACRKKPFVRHRISRCFFGPTNRPPFFIDELTDDLDYYPEAYLDKLAHESVNGLWLTVYLRDYPTTVMPGHGKDAEKRYAKLRQVVEKCRAYGIKIYLFMSEPKLWGNAPFCVPEADAAKYPEMIGFKHGPYGLFCTSSEAGKRYFEETVGGLFSNVPGLGGVINIMYGEDNGSCASSSLIFPGTPVNRDCPRCSRFEVTELYAEQARLICGAMHKYNPEAEYIGWFYAPGQRDGSAQSEQLRAIAEKFPENCTFMLNFESGVAIEQLGKVRTVFDYSLACVGPSRLFGACCGAAGKMGAKLQVGCSHENAAIPFMPVPENLYDKYRFMASHNVSAVMQCWYFGNYPGLMNKAAGSLSFLPFPEDAGTFLEDLARPDWGKEAPLVAEAWRDFSRAYRNFPGNLAFEWYGPLHNCIAWPLHLFPVNEPIAPSWILKNYPEVSGDRIGECLGFGHTLEEALTLCRTMSALWRQGLEKLLSAGKLHAEDPARAADTGLARAIGLQMKSVCNVLEFYFLRQEMFYTKRNHLERMAELVRAEIGNAREMIPLCEKDCRLGYHSEAEGYHFWPEKLQARIGLLEELLAKDFPAFDLDSPEIDAWTGRRITGKSARCGTRVEMAQNTAWRCTAEGRKLRFELEGVRGKKCVFFLELNRIHPPLKVTFYPDGRHDVGGACFSQVPDLEFRETETGAAFTVDLEVFADFLVPGAPLRLNVYGDGFAWVEHTPLPPRLTYGDTNWNCAGWLLLP